MTRLWLQYLTHPPSLPFFSAEPGSGQVLVTWLLVSPTALPPSHLFAARRQRSQQLSGTEWHRPIYNSPQAPDEDDAGRGNNITVREKSPEPPAALFMMATNREHQLRHMTEFPRTMYPFTFNSMRSHSPFDLLASSHLFGRFGADLPKEMAALCEYKWFVVISSHKQLWIIASHSCDRLYFCEKFSSLHWDAYN